MSNPGSQPCGAAAIRATRGVIDCARRQQRWVLTAAVLASTMAFVDESVVNVALPRIQTDLGTTLAAMQWVVNAYTLCMSALLLVGGAAGDQLGRRRMFLMGVGIFALASLGCGLAPNAEVLIVARAVQGVGAAFLIPCSLAIIGAAFHEAERGAAIGIWSGASALAAGLGPLLGGWLVDHTSWRAIFLINPLLAVIALWIGLRHLPESRDPDAAPGIDWRGALLVFAALGALVYGLIEAAVVGWHDPWVPGSMIAGAALLVVFVIAEHHSHAPMMPLALFRSVSFSGINLVTLLLYGALGGAFFFVPFLLIQVHGFSATAAGAAFLPFALILGVLSRRSGRLADHIGVRWPLIIGPALVGLGFALLAYASSSPRYSAVLLPMIVLGFGMVITVTPLTTTVINAVPEHQTGIASGINNAVASVASLLMIAVLGTVALSALGRSLDQELASGSIPREMAPVIDGARGGFVTPTMPASLSEAERHAARAVIGRAFADAIRLVMLIASGLALASALIAALTIRNAQPERKKNRSPPH